MDSSMTCYWLCSYWWEIVLHDKSEENLLFGSRWRTTRESSKKQKLYPKSDVYHSCSKTLLGSYLQKNVWSKNWHVAFVTYDPAKYNSKNRPKWTIVTKPIASVNKDIVREMILKNLIPAIKRKMPLTRKNNVLYIQQDNAKPHLYTNDPDRKSVV